MKKQLILPKFKNEDEEFEFWSNLDISEYFEASDFKRFNLEQFMKDHAEPKSTRITMRVPTELVKKYKAKASKLDVPYQSLMKQQLAKLS
jgi:predicted DNA binding CopG/RHH family protein